MATVHVLAYTVAPT